MVWMGGGAGWGGGGGVGGRELKKITGELGYHIVKDRVVSMLLMFLFVVDVAVA